jgi:hypothetical protein
MRIVFVAFTLLLMLLAGGCSKTSAREECQKVQDARTTYDVTSTIGQADRVQNLSPPLAAWRYVGDDGQCLVIVNGTKVLSADFAGSK